MNRRRLVRWLSRLATVIAVAFVAASAAAASSALRFADVTAESGIDLTLVSGTKPSTHILEVNGGGVALFDFDRDGDLDLFFANGATLDDPENGPGSRLYANKGDGTFEDVTRRMGIDVRRWAMGVAVGDYDGDGHDDLYVTCHGPNVLLRNDVGGTGRFVDVTRAVGVGDDRWSTSAAFGDIDGDGDPDLYVANYLEFDPKRPPDRHGRRFQGVPVMAGPQGLTPQADVLYENLGNGKFRDITGSSGCQPEQPGYGLGVVVFDADRDGRPDIFVGNDSTPNFLFRNLGKNKFENVGVISGISSNFDGGNQATMGIALADVDGNGFPDVFTTNFSSDTNTLHLNLGGLWFDDRTSQYGLAMVSRPFLSWGTGFYDFDSDGDEDLLVASGHVYPQATMRTMDSDYEQPLLLFERRGSRFLRNENAGAVFDQRFAGRSTAFGDIDDDGDVDIVLTTLNDRVRVIRNDSIRRDVVVVELRERKGSRQAAGSLVELVSKDSTQRRWIVGGSYQSVDAPAAYFGLGEIQQAGELTVRVTWPTGKRVEHSGVSANRKTIVIEGARKLRSTTLRGRPRRVPGRD